MKCNTSLKSGPRKANKFALIRNKKKIEFVGKLGMRYDEMEARYKQMPDSPERDILKADMDEIEARIVDLSAEINRDVFGESKQPELVSEQEKAPSEGEKE